MMTQKANEIELMDYLKVLWRWKWIVLIPPVILMAVTFLVSQKPTPAFQTDAIIQAGYFMLQSPGGRLEKVMIMDPAQIAIQISQGSYNAKIAEALVIDPNEIPTPSAENLRDDNQPNYLPSTDLIQVSMITWDEQRAHDILLTLYELIKEDLDSRIMTEAQALESRVDGIRSLIQAKEVDIKINKNQKAIVLLQVKDKDNEIQTQKIEIRKVQNSVRLKELEIQSFEIEKGGLRNEIESERAKIQILEEQNEKLKEEKEAVEKRIPDLEEQQKKAMSQTRNEENALSLLMYSVEIQKILQYSTTLQEKIGENRLSQEDIAITIRHLEETLRMLDNQILRSQADIESLKADTDNIDNKISLINNEKDKIRRQITFSEHQNEKIRAEIRSSESEIRMLESQKANLHYTRLIKEPFSSRATLGQNPLYSMVIVGMISGLFFVLLVFFLDYIRRNSKHTG